jgi:hypothetical protein
LGEEHSITRDDSSLKCAPKGFDSIVARGYTGPDSKKDVIIKIDGKDVAVPQSKVVEQNQYKGSSFDKYVFSNHMHIAQTHIGSGRANELMLFSSITYPSTCPSLSLFLSVSVIQI